MIESITNLFKDKYLLIIFLIGLLLRILNPGYGSPVLYVSGDEPPNYMGALYMMVNRSPFVTTSIYPPLGSYVQIPFLLLAFMGMFLLGKVQSLDELKFFLITHQGYFLFVPRLISGFFGSMTIIIIYKIAQLIFPNKRTIHLLASLLFTFSFNHVQMSNSGRPWSFAVLAFALTVLFTLKSINKEKNPSRYCFLAGLFTTISFGAHQVGVVALWIFLLIRLSYGQTTLAKQIKDSSTWLGVVVAVIGIVLLQMLRIYAPTTEWFILGKYPNLVAKLMILLAENRLFYNIKQLFISEPIIFSFFLISLFNKKNWQKPLLPIYIFIISVFIVFGISFIQPRYFLPLIILMSIFSSNTLSEFYRLLKLRLFRVLLFVCIISIAFYNAFTWSWIYLQKPTFLQAKEWIDNHINENEIIISTASRFMPYTPAKEMIKIQQKRHPLFFSTAAEILSAEQYPNNVRNIIYLGEVGNIHDKKAVQTILNQLPVDYKYVINIYFTPYDTPLTMVDTKNWIKVVSYSPFKDKTVKTDFDNILTTVDWPILPLLLWQLERSGPYIDIYKI